MQFSQWLVFDECSRCIVRLYTDILSSSTPAINSIKTCPLHAVIVIKEVNLNSVIKKNI